MKSKAAKIFRPKNVPLAAFDMFSYQTNVLPPASALALNIPDQSIRSMIVNLSINNNLSTRKNAFLGMIKAVQKTSDQHIFYLMIKPICSIFDQEVTDFYQETRLLSLKLVNEVFTRIKKIENSNDTLVSMSTLVFPPLLILSCDTDTEVSKFAKDIFVGFFPTTEKRNSVISKMRREISLRLKSIFNELKKPEWSLSEKDKNDNWGRVCTAALVLATNVLAACHFSKDVYTSFGEIPLIQWMKLKDGHFEPRVTPIMRNAAYALIGFGVQCDLIQLNGSREIVQFISADTSPISQTKLISLTKILIQKKLIEVKDIQNALLKSYELYYDPETINLNSLLILIKDNEFIEKSLTKVALFKDLNTASKLFDCIFKSEPNISTNFLIELLKNSISLTPPSHFYSQCNLEYYITLKDNENIDEILKEGNELRVIEYLNLIDDKHTIVWLKSLQSIMPETLIKLINKQGCIPIRQTWKTLSNIPLKVTMIPKLVEFLLLFIHSDEVIYVIETYPECIPLLLTKWNSDYKCFQCPELLNITEELLNDNMQLIPIFIKIFPNNNNELLQMIDELIIKHLNEDGQFDPSLFEYIKPSEKLLDTIIFSDAISILYPEDKYIIPYITKRIEELINSSDPKSLATSAAKFVEVTELDPMEIKTSFNDSPLFCYEYWKIIGFDNMEPINLCKMLNCYLEKKCKFLLVYLYLHDINWNFVSKDLWNYLTKHKELIDVAHKEKLLLILSCLLAANNINFNYFKDKIDGEVMFALSDKEPPDGIEKDDLSKVIQFEWNHKVPVKPSFSIENNQSIVLRQSIVYLQHYLPTINDITEFIDVVKNNIETSNVLYFFYCIRILSLISELNIPFQSNEILLKIVQQINNIQEIPPIIEKELIGAFNIGKYMTIDQFMEFSISIVNYFTTEISPVLSRLYISLISFFNAWSIVDSCFDHKLNLSNVKSWYFITSALLAMPYQKRLKAIDDFSIDLKPLLSSLPIESDDFLNLITAFPTTAMKWSTKLPNSKTLPLFSLMEKSESFKVFHSISESLRNLKLENTTINIDNNNRTISAVYNEGPASIPVKLAISFPKRYPFCHVKVDCEFGDESSNCEHNVSIAIIQHQTIEAGIITWHNFVTKRLCDAEPCTICYSYLSEEMKKPNIACPTCGNKFHGKCLQKWFSKCMKPTCPYCASPWDEKKRNK